MRAVSAALTARGLSHEVPGRALYAGLDVSIAAGEVVAVVGPNGAGKSTLLRTLAGLTRPQTGAVWLGDDDLKTLPARARARRLAYLPQATSLAYALTVREVVLLGRAPFVPTFAAPGRADHEAAARALARVGLAGFAERDVRTLSGGEFQRVMLARMLAGEAQVLVLDEPTAALDVGQALAFLGELRGLASEGAAVVLALHDLALARRHADAAVLLAGDGSAVVGPVEHVLSARNLADAFSVGVRELGGHLVFEPR